MMHGNTIEVGLCGVTHDTAHRWSKDGMQLCQMKCYRSGSNWTANPKGWTAILCHKIVPRLPRHVLYLIVPTGGIGEVVNTGSIGSMSD